MVSDFEVTYSCYVFLLIVSVYPSYKCLLLINVNISSCLSITCIFSLNFDLFRLF